MDERVKDIEQVADLIRGIRVAMLTTVDGDGELHGRPMATQDVDFVMDVTAAQLRDLVERFHARGLYVSETSADEALRTRGQFNVIDARLGWKVDLILRKERAFSRSEFERRMRVELGGLPVWMATAEDTIVAKLEWARTGGSERQLRDVAGILEVSGGRLDRAYVERWVVELGLGELWQQVAPGSR